MVEYRLLLFLVIDQFLNKKSRNPGVLLDNYSWYDKCHFSAELYHNSLLQTKTIKNLWLTLTQYLTMHTLALDHFQQLNCDLSNSLWVKCDSVLGIPIYGSIYTYYMVLYITIYGS